jgi:hypothetical protein
VKANGVEAGTASINYLTLPRSGLLAPHLSGSGVSWVCVGVCSQSGHSGSRLHRRLSFAGGSECPSLTDQALSHTNGARFLSQLDVVGDTVSLVGHSLTARVSTLAESAQVTRAGAVSSLLAPSTLAKRDGAVNYNFDGH